MTALCNQPEAFASHLGDDQSRDLYYIVTLCMVRGCSKSKSSLPSDKGYMKNPMVTFKIADDDEDESTADTRLLPLTTSDAAPSASADINTSHV